MHRMGSIGRVLWSARLQQVLPYIYDHSNPSVHSWLLLGGLWPASNFCTCGIMHKADHADQGSMLQFIAIFNQYPSSLAYVASACMWKKNICFKFNVM